jgi:hypothetical protein
MRNAIAWVLGAFAALTCCPAAGLGGAMPPWDPQSINAVVAMEATQDTLASLLLARGSTTQPQVLGSWTGVIDGSGWNLNFTGSYLGIGLSLFHVGTLDVAGDQETWSSSGTYGSTTFSETGSISFDPSWFSDLLYIANRVIVRGTQVFATVTTAAATAPVGGSVPAAIAVGTFSAVVSEGAIKVGDQTVQKWTTSGGIGNPPPNPPVPTPLFSLSYISDPNATGVPPLFLYQYGGLDQATGQAQFTATSVPEPSALVLLGAGAAGLLLRGARRHRRV